MTATVRTGCARTNVVRPSTVSHDVNGEQASHFRTASARDTNTTVMIGYIVIGSVFTDPAFTKPLLGLSYQ
jgi:hypothetical protein